jgi:hypothetical protein
MQPSEDSSPDHVPIPPHSCIHCQQIVIDTIKDRTMPMSLLVFYKSFADLLEAYDHCHFIRLTLASWEPDLDQLRLLAKERLRKPKLLSYMTRPPVINLWVEFKWDVPRVAPTRTFGAVELQWEIKGQSKDPRPFLINTESGKCTSSFVVNQSSVVSLLP